LTAPEDSEVEQARSLLESGATGRAAAMLRELEARRPRDSDVQVLLADALSASGDRVGAETVLNRALAARPDCAPAAVRLAGMLTPRRRATEAIQLLGPLVDSPQADVMLFTALGLALKTAGRAQDAVAAYRRAADAAPADPAAQHNLAGALGDASRFAESLRGVEHVFALGLDTPETRLVQGRAFFGLGRYGEAEQAFREAIARRPHYADAHAELAQLIWMRTEDVALALAELDRAIQSAASDSGLALAKAKVLEYAGDREAAFNALTRTLEARPSDVPLQIGAAQLLLHLDPEMALARATRAHELAPDYGPAASMLCQANLAVGHADAAASLAEGLMRDWPLDQHPVTLAATAWRLLGDPRYRELYDYDRLVVRYHLSPPMGWNSLDAFLTDLAESLRRLHNMRAHPIGQSLRRGVQTGEPLTQSADPVVKAFLVALDVPIRDYIERLREKPALLGRRATTDYRFAGAWSVLLRPGGHHVNHIHPMGWISSAFHVELPAVVDEGRQGWMKFGEPPFSTTPLLGPEHFVKPEAGVLVLFPSYMWHGTVPFGGGQPRLSAAFDVVPD
jgi:tetratricopeptide (TPR) repeat protein